MRKFLFGFLGMILLLLILVVSLSRLDMPLDSLLSQYATGNSEFVMLNGQNVHFRDEGEGEAVLLLHGISSSLHTWDAWTAVLQDSFRVLRLDLPGFGLTGPQVDGNYSQAAYADFLRDFLAARGIERCHLVGNSMGGGIACSFALRYPEKVNKLILVDAAVYRDPNQAPTLAFRLAKTPVLSQLMRYLTPRFMVEKSIREVYADPSKITPALLDRYDAMLLASGNRQALIDRLNQPPDSVQWDIRQIHHPTLVIWGEEDRWIPVSHVDSFLRDLPLGRARVYPGVGHLPMEEAPAETVGEVMGFLLPMTSPSPAAPVYPGPATSGHSRHRPR
jgi:pimeloyl-ACP methyl ester carboxylesterase